MKSEKAILAEQQTRKFPIDEGRFIKVRGVDQWITLRGRVRSNPVIVIVAGTGAALSPLAPFFEMWEKDFTLVQWDQPAAGATHSENPNLIESLSLEGLALDGLAVVEYVRTRLEVDAVILLGLSGGSVVGLKMIQLCPEVFSAYVGSGQFVDWAEQDSLSYTLVLDKAQREGNDEALLELQEIGPPPYADSNHDVIKSKYAGAMTDAESEAFPAISALWTTALSAPPATAHYLAPGLQLANPRDLSLAAYNRIRAELMAFNAHCLGLTFQVPVFFLQGQFDLYSVTCAVQKYAAEITAPVSRTVIIKGGGHSPFLMREKFLQALNLHVRPTVMRQEG